MQRDDIVRHIGERHDYARHIYQLFVAWFTVFITVNFATMGWLAKAGDTPARSAWLTSLLVLLFIVQNILGIAACSFIRAYLSSTNEVIRRCERQLEDQTSTDAATASDTSGTLPLALYRSVAALIAVALLFTTVAWSVLPFMPVQVVR